MKRLQKKPLRWFKKALDLSEEERERLSKSAIETAQQYSIERTVDKYEELFKDLLGIS